MNRRLLTLTQLTLATLLLTFVMVSCNKNHQKINTDNQSDYTELIEKSKDLKKHVTDFKSRMEFYRNNPGVKTGGQLYTKESAILEIENLINYNFCYTGLQCNKKSYEETELIMPLDDLLKINDPKLSEVYFNQLIDSLQAQMGRVNYTNMKLLLVDLELGNIDSNGDAVVIVGALIGNEATSVLHNDSWIYGDNQGLCSSGWTNDEDAASQLATRVTNAMLPDPPNGYMWTFGNPHSKVLNPKDHPLTTSPDNYLDYKIFYAEENAGLQLTIGDDEECLTMYEMNFYEDYYIDFAEGFENEYSQKFSNCILYGQPEYSPHSIKHYYTIIIGTRHLKYPFEVDDILEY
jgi:hypothetical protein